MYRSALEALVALDALDLFVLQDTLTLGVRVVELDAYDFAFRRFLPCRSLVYASDQPVLLRVGAIDDYRALSEELREAGIALLQTPDAHERCASIAGWGALLAELTPETWLLDRLPPVAQVEGRFGWPVFIKGERQTSRHRAELSIARDREDYARICAAWDTDPILRWQRPALRRFVPLRRVGERPGCIAASFEFRVFCWRREVAAFGRYWTSHRYDASEDDARALTALAAEAARRVDVPFLVVDVAQTTNGDWIVIECNDGQESAYGGVAPLTLWPRVLEIERAWREHR